ncbi:MAG: hypothetical protein JOZ83_10450 [Silvibacterium sp.]|nr:hypothetical protein [Silvibacterium sp.]
MILRIVLYCLLGGVGFMLPALGAGHAGWWWLSGVLVTAAFVPIALFGPKTGLGQFGVISPVLLLVSVLTTWSEAVLFIRSPLIQEHAVANLTYDSIGHLIAAAVLAVLWKILKLTQPCDVTILRPAFMKAIGLISVGAFVYVVCYFIFGSITYQFFTKKYYPEGAAIARAMGLWFWLLELGRGLLIILAIVPAVYTLRLSRWNTAICVGLLLWITGGLALLIVPNELLGGPQRFIHTIEILTENFPPGVIAALLLRGKAPAEMWAGSAPHPSRT